MSKGIFIVGTNTDVGKTVVAGGLTYLLRQSGHNACYFKPVLSGALVKNDQIILGDTQFVKDLSQICEPTHHLTPFSFTTPVSPHLASEIENKSIDLDTIYDAFTHLKNKYPYMIVEGAGGMIVPLSKDLMLYDVIKKLQLPLLIVADAGLGTINHTLLTVNFAKSLGIEVAGIILNQYDNSNFCHQDNKKIIEEHTNVCVCTLPKLKNFDTQTPPWKDLKETIKKHIDIETFIQWMKSC